MITDKINRNDSSLTAGSAVFLFVSGIIMFFHIDCNIPTADVESPFSGTVRDPILSILKLERFYRGSSVFDRADAIIIGLQKLLETGGIMSNYMFWGIVWYVFISESGPWNNEVRKIKEV